jgi:hypothetical protein
MKLTWQMRKVDRQALPGSPTVTAAALVLSCHAILVSGCVSVRYVQSAAVAPDHATVAWVSTSFLGELSLDGRIWRWDVSLKTAAADAVQRGKSIWLGSPPLEIGHYSSIGARLLFSPDSRHVAVIAGGCLWLVDAKSGAAQKLTSPMERVTSCCWTGNDELAFGAIRKKIGLGSAVYSRSLWLARVRPTVRRGQPLYEGSGNESYWYCAATDWPLENWSPRATYVIFVDLGEDRLTGQLTLLDVRSGQLQRFGQAQAMDSAVAWTRAGDAAFCVTTVRAKNVQAQWVSVPGPVITDLSGKAGELFGYSVPRLDPCWTADGEFVLAASVYAQEKDPSYPMVSYSVRRGACLIRPQPWTVKWIGSEIKKSLQVPPEQWPEVFSSPVPGWVAAAMWVKGADFGVYAVDYSAQRSQLLFTTNGVWAMSDDGEMAVTIDEQRRAHIHHLRWP